MDRRYLAVFVIAVAVALTIQAVVAYDDPWSTSKADDRPWWQRGMTGDVVHTEPTHTPPVFENDTNMTHPIVHHFENHTNHTRPITPVHPISITGRTLNVTCIQMAIDARDTKIIAAVGAYDSSVSAGLQTRMSALDAAWALPEALQRNPAISAAWEAYKAAWRVSVQKLRTDREAAWMQFKADLRTCGPGAMETQTASVDQLAQ